MKPFDYNNEKYLMGHLFLDAMRSRPDAIDAATGESRTNATLLRQPIQLARCLRRFGTQPGDVVALSGRNHLDLDIPFYAALLNGMPIAGVDPMFKYPEIKSHFKVSSPRVVFCQKEAMDDHLEVIKELELNTKVICFDDREYSLKRFFEEYDNGKEDETFESVENNLGLQLSPVQWISSYFATMSSPVMNLTKLTSSAQPTVEHVIDIKKKIRPGAIITELYGQTENLGPVLLPNPTGPISNCGRANYKWHTVKLVDSVTRKEITEPFVKGEIWTKGVNFTEYYNNPEETAKAFTEDGWYKTGDILYKDKENNYFFVERISMLIKCRNYHVIPAELEAVIREHPGVYDVCVTSIPHKEDGQHPVACVVRKHGSNITAQEIKDIVAGRLSESQHLRGGVVFMDKLPLTTTGKLARGKLQQMTLTARRE